MPRSLDNHRFIYLLGAVLFLAACGGSDGSPEKTPSATPTVSEILATSSQRMASTQSLRFRLGVDGVTYVDNAKTIQLLEANGELQRPDRVHARFKIKIKPGVTLSTEIISISGQTWATNLITGNWGAAPEEFSYDPSVLFDNQGGVGPVMNKVTDPQIVGMEEIDGKASYHVTGTVTEEVVGPVTSSTMHGSPVAVDVWIDARTFDLLRAKLAEPASADNAHPATWTLDLYDQNKKITVEPPS